MCVLILSIYFIVQLLFQTLLILRRIQRDTIINKHRYSCHIFIKSTDLRKILKYKILRKSFQWEPRCSMRDGQTGRYDKTKSRFLQSLTRLKMVQHSLPCSQADAEFVLILQQHQQKSGNGKKKTLLKGGKEYSGATRTSVLQRSASEHGRIDGALIVQCHWVTRFTRTLSAASHLVCKN